MTLVNFRHFSGETRLAAGARRPFGALPSIWRGADYGEERITYRIGPNPHAISRHGGSGEEAIRRKTIGQSDASTACARSTLQQQVEDLERTLPMPGLRVLEIRIDDLERARERYAQFAADGVKLGLGLLAEIQIERGVWR